MSDAQDATLVTMARAALARVGAASGASVRDSDGRTYAAAPVSLPSLRLSALQGAVAAAVSAGATGLEAAALVGQTSDDAGLAAVRDLGGADVPVLLVARDGQVTGRLGT